MRHLCDVNVWLALTTSAHLHAEAARAWMNRMPAGDEACFCRQTEMALLRLLTTVAAMGADLVMTNAKAQEVYLTLRSDERVGWLDEPAGLRESWFRQARLTTPAPKIWSDAYLAALAQLSGATLVTFDTGFRRYANGSKLVLLA